MKIANGTVVSIDYKLHLGDGVIVDASGEGDPLTYLHGDGQIVPGLERELAGLGVGDARKVVVPPADGYGDRDLAGLQQVDRKAFPPGVELAPGLELSAVGPNGEQIPFVVHEVTADKVVVDMNHPLAGKTLHFDVTVREVRTASAEELEHGHAHGEGCGGHGHDHGGGGCCGGHDH
jgi:FKBP-type peptidyl-prolyl cis-trans isomerase SlyD